MITTISEFALVMIGEQGPMIGIVTRTPAVPVATVLIVAGQPQTRTGAHRMFVTLARSLALQNIASLRFDCGGWGDSPGEALPFERSVGDITTAALALRDHLGIPDFRLVVLGLCDGASAAIFALRTLRDRGIDPKAFCQINPWVRGETGHADAMLKTYYAKRVFEKAMWKRLLSGRISLDSILELVRAWRVARQETVAALADRAQDLPSQLLVELQNFRGAVWTILSGDDLTAAETEALMRRNSDWRRILAGTPGHLLRIAGADHTLTRTGHWQEVMHWIGSKCHDLTHRHLASDARPDHHR